MPSSGPDSATHQLHCRNLEQLYHDSRTELGSQSPEVLLNDLVADSWRSLALRSWADNKHKREERAPADGLRAYDAIRAELMSDLSLLDWSDEAIWRNLPDVPLRWPWRWLAPLLLTVLWVVLTSLRFIYRHGMIVGLE